MKRVLYLTYDGLTDPLGQSQILPYLIGLSKLNYTFTIVSFEKKERFQTQREKIELLCHAHNLQWIPLSYTSKPPIISTLCNIWQLKHKVMSLHKSKCFDIVHVRSYITAFAGLHLKIKKNVKFIFDMRGFWADERVDGGLWNQNKWLYRKVYQYFKNKEKQFIYYADAVITLTYHASEEIKKWNIKPRLPVFVIPCCVDTELFNPDNIDKNKLSSLKSSLGIKENDFVLGYLGSIGTWYMPDEMLDFFIELKKIKTNAKFLFITPKPYTKIQDAIHKKSIPGNDIIILSAERNEVINYLLLCKLTIFFIKPCYSKTASSATKSGEALSMGIPFITNYGIGDLDNFISQYKCGITIHNFNSEEYAKSINRIPEILSIPVSVIRKIAVENFALKKGVEMYNKAYLHCILNIN